MKPFFLILFGSLLVATAKSSMAIVSDSYHEIHRIYTYTEYADHTFLITLKNSGDSLRTHCPGGFWASNQDGKNAGVLSMALSAFHSKSKILMYADAESDWPGWSSKECKIQLIVVE